ncbi:ATP-binding protein [Methanospirillum lacunae]
MLILLYDLIPDRIYIQKKIQYSVYVGLIFTFVALSGILIPWNETAHPTMGINGIVLPLSGIVGGPVSAGIIACFLVFFRYIFDMGPDSTADLILMVISAIIGIVFFYLKKRQSVLYSSTLILVSFSLFVSVVSFFVLQFFHPYGPEIEPLRSELLIQIPLIIFLGLFILGSVINLIDRKKTSELELLSYKDHLEELVELRTIELQNMSALQQATIESTADGVIVVDLLGKIQNYNRVAAHILHLDNEGGIDDIGIWEILSRNTEYPVQMNVLLSPVSLSEEQLLSTDLLFKSGKVYEIYVTPHKVHDKTIGSVINLREITERKNYEDRLKLVNQKLLLLSGITRHDIVNQLTALRLYGDMIRHVNTVPLITEYAEKMDQIMDTMQQQAEFTSDYQDLGLYAPVWQSPSETFINASLSFTKHQISFSTDGDNVEILVDRLLDRVFYNLIDNSIRHGSHVSIIRLSVSLSSSSVLIMYEDNGSGIAPEEKELIFQKGFGKNTGFGMFLIHEILSMTSITIRETGLYGIGARFEMSIPEGKFRMVSESIT